MPRSCHHHPSSPTFRLTSGPHMCTLYTVCELQVYMSCYRGLMGVDACSSFWMTVGFTPKSFGCSHNDEQRVNDALCTICKVVQCAPIADCPARGTTWVYSDVRSICPSRGLLSLRRPSPHAIWTYHTVPPTALERTQERPLPVSAHWKSTHMHTGSFEVESMWPTSVSLAHPLPPRVPTLQGPPEMRITYLGRGPTSSPSILEHFHTGT